jgi:cytochrome P450
VYSLISDTNTKSHDRFKSYMALGYSGKDVPSLEGDIDKVIETFMRVIKRDHLSTESETNIVDFARLCTFFTIDSISTLGFGEAMGYLEHNSDRYGYIEAVQNALPIISVVSVLPLATSILNIPFIKNTFAPTRKDSTGIGRLLRLADRTAESALAADINNRHDMVASWLRHGYPRDARRLSADIVLQLVAGGDSTATVIKTTTLYVASNPRILLKLREELDSAETEGRISSHSVITNKESLQLPYLQAVVKEGLRIFVPGHGLLIKQVPPGGDTIDGKWVPGGTRIAHSQWSQQRDAIYGKDPERFWPERWLEVDAARRGMMEKQLDLAFGVGRFACLGKPVAWMEMNKIFAEVWIGESRPNSWLTTSQLFRRFDFEILNPIAPLVALPHSVFVVKDMFVRITERERDTR